MRGWLLGLVPWMVTAAAGLSGLRPAEVNYTHIGSIRDGVYRDGDTCWIRPETALQLGWKVRMDRREADVRADSRRLRVPVRTEPGGLSVISLTAALEQLGGLARWDSSNRLNVTGELRRLEIKGSNIEIDATLEAWARQSRYVRPDRLVLDFVGLSVAEDFVFRTPAGIKASPTPDGRAIRVEIERPGIASFPLPAIAPARNFNIFFDGLVLDAPVPVASPPQAKTPDEEPKKPVVDEASEREQPAPAQPPQPVDPSAVTVNKPRIVSSTPGAVRVSFPISRRPGSAPIARYDEPTSVVLTIPGARWTGGDSNLPKNDLLKGMLVATSGTSLRITLQTARALGFRLTTTATEVQLAFNAPKVRQGSLSGKIIVVDAGHGGSDSGAVSPDKKVREKDITLAISRLVANELTEEGAAAIMSRDEDVRIGLKERADLANRNGADLFISIHVNSNSINNSRSGTMIFHHMQEETSKLLATCIAHEVEQVSGIPCMGAWSDSRIYRTGFSVLRNTTMPGVLCELGFINHSTDRAKMVTAEFQQKIARAIVKGVKVFLGDAKPSPSKK